jgi:hypothetical protein
MSAVEKDVATDVVDMVPRGSNPTATVLVAKTDLFVCTIIFSLC